MVISHDPIIIKGGATVTRRKDKEIFHETVWFCRCSVVAENQKSFLIVTTPMQNRKTSNS